MYNTNYQIFEKQTDKLLFTNTNSACFAEFTNGYRLKPEQDYSKGRYMKVYASTSQINPKVTEEIIKFWLEQLEIWGLKVTVEKENLNKTDKNLLPSGVIRGKNYVFILDFDNYTSKAQLNLALNLVRNIYETRQYILILKVKELMEQNEKEFSFNYYGFACSITRNTESGHHIFYPGRYYKLMTKKDLNNLYNKWEKEKYANCEIGSFSNSQTVNSMSISKLLHSNITFDEYKNLKI